MVLLYQPSKILISIYQSGNNNNKEKNEDGGVGFGVWFYFWVRFFVGFFMLDFWLEILELHFQFSGQTVKLKIAFFFLKKKKAILARVLVTWLKDLRL